MRHRRLLNLLVLPVLLLALLVVDTCPAFAAGAPLPTPDTGTWVTDGTVNSSAIGQVGPNLVLFIGGNFSTVGPSTGCGVALDPSTGTVSAAFPSVNGSVLAAVADGSGGYYIGGSFSRVGTQTRNDIAHILSDGSLDPSFDPNVNSVVQALAVSGSTVYAGGRFTTVNGGAATRNYLAAFNAATGAVTSWKPDPNNFVNTLLVSGSTVYAGGSFTSVNTTTAPVPRNYLAAFDTATGSATSWDPSANAQVNALALSGSIIYAGGRFTTVNGGATLRYYLAAFDATTGAVTPWKPDLNDFVNTLLVSGSTVYAGGNFTLVNTTTTPVPRSYLAAFDTATGSATSWDPSANAQVSVLALSGSIIYAGGSFTTVNGTTNRNRLAAFDVATGTASSWNPSAGGTVSTLAVSGSTVYAGGGFGTMGGVTRSNLAAISLTTGMPTSWDPSAGGAVNAVVVSGSTVYAGGAFTSVNTSTTPAARSRLAAFDTTTGIATSWDPSPDNTVYALLVSGSTVYAGGSFTYVNTTSTTAPWSPYLAAFSTTGTGTATPWGVAAAPNASVRALALSSDSELYAGGTFTSVGSVSRNYLAAFDTMTGKTMTWDPNPNGTVNTLLVSGSTVYAGGGFVTVNQNVTRRYLAAFDATTGAATPWDPSPNSVVSALLVSGSTVYAGGSFGAVNSSTTPATRKCLAAFDTTTGIATSWDPNLSGGSALALTASAGSLYAGGSFQTVGGVSRSNLASFTLDATPPNGSVTIGDASALSRARSVTLHLSAADAHGPVLMQVRNAGDSWPLVWSSLSDIPWTLPSPDGDKRIEARFTDAAGNISTYSATVTLDTTPPSGWIWVANGAAVVNSTATTVETWANDLNGPVQMRLSNGGSPWSDWAPVIDDTFQPWTLPSDDGTKVVGVQYKDAAGNIALCSQSVILDTAPPLGSLSIDSGASYTASTSATLSLSATDAVGTTQVRLRNADDSTWGDWQKLDADDPTNVTADTGWTLPAGDGAKTVQAQFKDVGGNVSAVAGASVVLDTTKPVTTDNADGLPHRSFTLELTPTDATSGVVLTEYRIDGHAWREGTVVTLRLAVHRKPSSLARGAHTIQYRSTDAAGNVESIKSCTVKLR